MKKEGKISLRRTGPIAVGALTIAGLSAAIGTQAPALASSSNQSLLTKIEQSGKLTVGLASAQPWQVQDPKTGQWSGVFVDLMKNWAQVLGVKFVPVNTTWQNMISGLQAGHYDVASSLNATPARALSVVYTVPVVTDLAAFALYPAKVPGVTSWAALNQSKYTICVQQGSAEDLGLTAEKPKATILRLPDENSCRLALQTGRASAFFDDWNGQGPFAKATKGVRLMWAPTPIVDEGIDEAIAPGYDDYATVQAMDIEIQSFSNSGLLAQSESRWNLVNPLAYAIGVVPDYVKQAAAQEFPSGS